MGRPIISKLKPRITKDPFGQLWEILHSPLPPMSQESLPFKTPTLRDGGSLMAI